MRRPLAHEGKRCPVEDKHRGLRKGERCPICNHPSDADMFAALGLQSPVEVKP